MGTRFGQLAFAKGAQNGRLVVEANMQRHMGTPQSLGDGPAADRSRPFFLENDIGGVEELLVPALYLFFGLPVS